MAQVDVAANEGITEMLVMATDISSPAASAVEQMCLVKTACAASIDSGYATFTQCTEENLSMVTAATCAVSADSFTNDTIHIEHPFTCGSESATVKGFIAVNHDGDAVYYSCCFAGDISLEPSDTITCSVKARHYNV